MNLSIGITTFQYRYDKYFKPLLEKIKEYNPEIEVIVAINGEHKQEFDQTYRRDILRTISNYPNTYPIMYTEFRGLSKLWNNIIITSTNEYILMLNDDISIINSNYINEILLYIEKFQTSFKINYSWSHVLLKKQEVMDIGFFDERMLGIGEEDGWAEWKYQDKFKKPFASIQLSGIINYVDMSHNPTNTKVIKQGKYSLLNQKVMYEEIFSENDEGMQYGVCPIKLIVNDNIIQYPHEQYYLDYRDKL